MRQKSVTDGYGSDEEVREKRSDRSMLVSPVYGKFRCRRLDRRV